MLVLIEITYFAAIEPLLFGIPESVGLLAFGVGLTATAVIIRWFLGRDDAEQTEDDRRKKV